MSVTMQESGRTARHLDVPVESSAITHGGTQCEPVAHREDAEAPTREDAFPYDSPYTEANSTRSRISSSGRFPQRRPCPPRPPGSRRVRRIAPCPPIRNTRTPDRRIAEPPQDSSSSERFHLPGRTAASPAHSPGSSRSALPGPIVLAGSPRRDEQLLDAAEDRPPTTATRTVPCTGRSSPESAFDGLPDGAFALRHRHRRRVAERMHVEVFLADPPTW